MVNRQVGIVSVLNYFYNNKPENNGFLKVIMNNFLQFPTACSRAVLKPHF